MKKLFCFLAISCLGASCALADLGDGREAAEQRWGKAVSEQAVGTGGGSVVRYISNGWAIEQFYNGSGSAAAVRYYKLVPKGKRIVFITDAERNALWSVNTSPEGDVHWEYLSKSTNNQQMWYSEECKTLVHLEVVQTDKNKWAHCLIFATVPDGTDLLSAYINGPSNNAVAGDPTKLAL